MKAGGGGAAGARLPLARPGAAPVGARAAALPLAILLAALAGCGAQPAAAAPHPAAGFTVSGIDGQPHRLADYRGKVVILNFWATWCIPCRAEIPDLEHEYRAHRAEGLVVLGMDYKESRDDVVAFATEYTVSYPVLLDADGRVHDAYAVGGLPQTFVIDARGRVVSARTGIASRATMEQEYQAAARAG